MLEATAVDSEKRFEMKISKNRQRCICIAHANHPGNTTQVLRKAPFHSACRTALRMVCIHNTSRYSRAAGILWDSSHGKNFDVFTHLQNRITKDIRHRLTMQPIFVYICFLPFPSAARTAFQSHPLGAS